jgi:ParB family transcriptional regulator, chromosome partitioning protein
MSKTTGLASISEGRSDIHRINPKLIHVKNGWNSRDFKDPANVEHVQMLAQSIAEVGVKEPLTVNWEDGKAYLEDGECRLKACLYAIEFLKADIKTIPVKAGERYANDGDKLFSQQLRNAGKPFTVLEQAKLFKRLIDLGWQQGDIAKKAGISPARVSQILDFNTMPQGVKTMVHNGEVSPSTAMAVVKEQGTAAEAALAAGLAVAKANGGTKVMAKHVEGATQAAPKVNKLAAVKDALDYSSVDDEDDGMVLIRMPVEHWEIVRKLLEL